MKGTAKEKVVYFHTPNSLETRRMVQELHFCGVISSEKTKLRNTQTTESVQDHTTGTAIRIEGPNCLYWWWWILFFFSLWDTNLQCDQFNWIRWEKCFAPKYKNDYPYLSHNWFWFHLQNKKKKNNKENKKTQTVIVYFSQKWTRLPCPVGGGDLMPVLRVLGQGAHMATHDLRLLSAAGADCDFFCSFWSILWAKLASISRRLLPCLCRFLSICSRKSISTFSTTLGLQFARARMTSSDRSRSSFRNTRLQTKKTVSSTSLSISNI